MGLFGGGAPTSRRLAGVTGILQSLRGAMGWVALLVPHENERAILGDGMESQGDFELGGGDQRVLSRELKGIRPW
ncbi:MAG: hypothetical protein RMJ84_08735 [Sandaracinaceae bacterium]|nr:hypothetical protein [Sandaracinaceae bacterium]